MIAILSKNKNESKRYAKHHKLAARQWCHIAGVHSVIGARDLDVVRIGGWWERPDLAEIEDALLPLEAVKTPKGLAVEKSGTFES